jgi:hypothetical protein
MRRRGQAVEPGIVRDGGEHAEVFGRVFHTKRYAGLATSLQNVRQCTAKLLAYAA